MKENLRVRVGAVVLALATLAAVIFAWLNFVQRSRYDIVDDGVAWTDSSNGIEAWKVAANSPASMAGIRTGDVLLAINDAPVPSAAHVARRLYRAGLWTQLRYKLSRNGEEFETRLITTPAQKPLHVENYLRFVGLLYLFIGLFIFIRRWNAPRAVHFYVFCLVSFILYSFQFSGKLDAFDLEVYWSSIIARLLAPALLLHFALVFPERAESSRNSLLKLAAVYTPPLVLLLVHILAAVNALGFVPTTRSRVALDQLELGFLGLCFLCCRDCLLPQLPAFSLRRPSSAVEVAHRRHPGGQLAVFSALHSSFCVRCRHEVLDAVHRAQLGLDSLVFRLRHHPLSLDGRGHHFQTRLGVHRGYRGRRRHLLCPRGPDRADFPVAKQRPGHRHDRHRGSRVSLSAFPRRHSGAPGPLLLPRSPRLPPHADRIRQHSYE